MSEVTDLDSIRRVALDLHDKRARRYRTAFFGAVAVEVLFLLGFLLLADLSNRMHLLLLIATMTIYTIVGLGLIALGLYLKECTGRIIKAIEALGESSRPF